MISQIMHTQHFRPQFIILPLALIALGAISLAAQPAEDLGSEPELPPFLMQDGPGPGSELPPESVTKLLNNDLRKEIASLRKQGDKLRDEWAQIRDKTDPDKLGEARREFARKHRTELRDLRKAYQKIRPQLDELREALDEGPGRGKGPKVEHFAPGPNGAGPGPMSMIPGFGHDGDGPGPGPGMRPPHIPGIPRAPAIPHPPMPPQGMMEGFHMGHIDHWATAGLEIAANAQEIAAVYQEIGEEFMDRLADQDGEITDEVRAQVRAEILAAHKDELDALQEKARELRGSMRDLRQAPPQADLPPELMEYQEAMRDLREQAEVDRQVLRESLRHALSITDSAARTAEVERVRTAFRQSQKERREALREVREELRKVEQSEDEESEVKE